MPGELGEVPGRPGRSRLHRLLALCGELGLGPDALLGPDELQLLVALHRQGLSVVGWRVLVDEQTGQASVEQIALPPGTEARDDSVEPPSNASNTQPAGNRLLDAAALHAGGVKAYGRGDFGTALAGLSLALRLQLRQASPDHPDMLAAANNLASVFWALARHKEARRLLQAVLQIRRRTLGADHPETLATASNLGASLQALGELEGCCRRPNSDQ